jgi:large subunit ribosomal protein L4
MKTQIYNLKNEKVGEVELAEAVFNAERKDHTVYEAVKNILANKRQGNASTLTRGTVNGTTRKPWKQKGTGRARAGSFKSPLWRGKGIIFGPHPRSYRYEIPKKVKQSAFLTVFSEVQASGKLKIIDDIKLDLPKTKLMAEGLAKLTSQKRVVYILSSKEKASYEKIVRACRNIPWVKAVNAQSLEINDLFYSDDLLIAKSALEEIHQRYA